MSGFNRKRRFGNDDYQQPYQKRFRLPPIVELSRTLCADLNTLGESVKKYVEDVDFMSVPIVSNFENEKVFRDAVLNTLLAITTEQPQKIPHIAGLIQVVNSKSSTVGQVIVEFFHQKAQEEIENSLSKDHEPQSFDTGPWNKLKLILRLLSSLSAIIEESSLTNIYSQLLKLASELQSQNTSKRSPLGEAIYYNTLISIPYLSIFESISEDSLKTLQSLAAQFKVVSAAVTITKPFNELGPIPFKPESIVNLILPAVNKEIEQNSNIFPDLKSLLSELIETTAKHTLPQFSLPSVEVLENLSGLDTGLGSVDGMWRTPRFTFEVYVPTNDLETTPSVNSYVSLLLKDITTDILEALEFNRKEVARQIITLDLFFREGTFAPPGSSIDVLKGVRDNNKEAEIKLSTWKIEDIAVETVLSLIYKLPTVSQPFAYFYTTLVEACTNASQAIAPVMGRAIRFFYAHLDSLDFELRLRYLDWLSVQLSNFNFTWKWREWEEDSQQQSNSDYHPKVSFIRNLISKELRLTSAEKIQSTLTEEFHKYLDISLFDRSEQKEYYVSLFGEESLDKVDLSFGPESSKFFFTSENLFIKDVTQKLIEGVHKNADLSAVITEIKELISNVSNSNALLISLVVQTVAFVGSRSISHANKYIGFTYELLKSLVNSVEDEAIVIDAVLHYWNAEPQNGFLVLDMLQSFDIISSITKIQYVLSDENRRNLGLVEISAIESLFRTLTSLVYTKGASNELKTTFNVLVAILSKVVKSLDTADSIPLPDIQVKSEGEVELSWKYHTVLGLIRSILRKYSDEYVRFDNELKLSIQHANHQPSVDLVSSWIDELKEL